MYSDKRGIVEDAFAEIGLAPYIFDLTVGMLQRALRRLEAMVAEWDATDHIRFGYPLSTNPDLDDVIDLPASVEGALVTNLAVIIAPGHGKVVSSDTTKAANRSRKAMANLFGSSIPERNVRALPTGAGDKPRRAYGTFTPESSNSFTTGDDGGPELF